MATRFSKHDWTTKHGTSAYGEVEVGNVYMVEGDIKECQWGLHFSENPLHCFNYYESLQWNKFAKVVAYGSLIEKGDKSVCSILEILEVLTFNEFLGEIRKFNLSRGVNGSDGVNLSRGVSDSYGVNGSDGVNGSRGVNLSYGVNGSNGVNGSRGVNRSNGVNVSRGVNLSYGVNVSYGVNRSYGVNDSNGVNDSLYVDNCQGIHKSIFANKKSGAFLLFNKQVDKDRIDEVIDGMPNWKVDFTNALYLKGNKKWYETNIPELKGIAVELAYSKMPKELEKYLRSLPEFDEEVFNAVMHRKVVG